MSQRISTSRATWLGLLVVNAPVLFLLCGPLFIFSQFVDDGAISRSYNWLGLLVFGAGFLLAWIWWSVSAPKWRLWAYQRVEDIAELKARSVSVGLTWPDGHFFERTEVKSRSHARREKELDTTARK
ncbi:hypothetical protein [Hydrogenophaga sp. 5NK40-0174]|uniref:hypothetical protein n=1 Tax=Hydrogenophaga sp. 5NK40-0174 TaxID=3127649 RepID=UPI003342ADDD